MNTNVSKENDSGIFNLLNSSLEPDWNIDWTAPQPNLDKNLLEQLYFIPGLKEVLILRQVHALEHATVWIISNYCHIQNKHICIKKSDKVNTNIEITKKALLNHFPIKFPPDSQHSNSLNDDQLFGGLSTEQGFYIYGDANISNLRRAANLALYRLTHGDWDLAVHPRCGTNLSVSMILTAAFTLGINLFLPKGPIEQFFGFGLAATTASEIAPDIGALVQRYITTAIPFNLVIEKVIPVRDELGRKTHFIKVKWQD